MKQLDAKLNLTADQKAKINAIWDDAEKKAGALRDDAAADRSDLREKRRQIMKDSHDAVRAVLTPDQQKIFDTEGVKTPAPKQ